MGTAEKGLLLFTRWRSCWACEYAFLSSSDQREHVASQPF